MRHSLYHIGHTYHCCFYVVNENPKFEAHGFYFKFPPKFRNNSEMKLHFSRFHDENPVMKHVCKICDKGFFKKSDLNVHLVKHTGAKPYKCLSCSKSFTVKNNLRKHEKNYCAQGNQDLTFKCMNCPSVFNGKEKLQRHLKRHE